VLVVDDDYDAAHLLELILTPMGFQVELAHNGHQALQDAAYLRPQILLMDIHLPDMNGFEVLQSLRAEPALASTHIAILSADTIFGRRRAAALDTPEAPLGFIEKPFLPRTIQAYFMRYMSSFMMLMA